MRGEGGGALGCLVLTVITHGYHGGDSEGKCQAGSKGEGGGRCDALPGGGTPDILGLGVPLDLKFHGAY